MRSRLQQSSCSLSPERALEQLKKIQWHKATINESKPVEGIGTVNKEQAQVFKALKVTKPQIKNQNIQLL